MNRKLLFSGVIIMMALWACDTSPISDVSSGGGASTCSDTTSYYVENNTACSICEIYDSRCTSDSWGSDALNGSLSAFSDSTSKTLCDGCWDFQVEFCNGSEVFFWNQNLTSDDGYRLRVNSGC